MKEPATEARVKEIIETFDMKPHPEGGFYRETYRSSGTISASGLSGVYSGPRSHSTCIYFLLVSGEFSAFHKIHQDEIWHFYDGSPVELHTLSEAGDHSEFTIGRDLARGQTPQLVVPGGHWFASRVGVTLGFSFVGCTVAPGFDFDDFVLAERDRLLNQFPQHTGIITALTR